MIITKEVEKNSTVNVRQNRNKALSLLIDEMAVWYPAPYYDIEAMVSKETKGFISNHRAKISASVCA
ncbi:MAG: hypothetical protein Q8M99_06745 [Methylotenera sp.]|nr:hypothetical protein [Methylotenera sp.]